MQREVPRHESRFPHVLVSSLKANELDLAEHESLDYLCMELSISPSCEVDRVEEGISCF